MIRDLDESKAPLLDHLIELRRRLLWCVGALLVGFFVCLNFAKEIFAVLVQPLLAAAQGNLIYTDIFEAFFVEVKVAFFAALMIASRCSRRSCGGSLRPDSTPRRSARSCRSCWPPRCSSRPVRASLISWHAVGA